MEVYLVGGAVRDQLLGLDVKERDFVVVGATAQQLLELGYVPVGKDFPVFLHPKTHEEYALARTERKVSKGYAGFKFYTDPTVTLEDDLSRRDLTINAIAQKNSGELIDPYHGVSDLKNKVLRHVSLAFVEDPVRILRLARFAARFADFKVHATTLDLMRSMAASGEVDALIPERIWQELQKTLSLSSPQRFFEVLSECGALPIIFPEIAAQVDLAIASLKNAVKFSQKNTIRFAALTRHLTVDSLKTLCSRNRIPTQYRELALLVVRYQKSFDEVLHFTSEEIIDLLEKLDAFRRPVRFMDFLATIDAAFGVFQSLNSKKLMTSYDLASKVSMQTLGAYALSGEEIKKELYALRCKALA